MADLHLKVTADTSDAQRKVKALGTEADNTRRKVDQASRTAIRSAERAYAQLRSGLKFYGGRAKGAATAFAGVLAGGGGIGEAALQGLALAVPEIGLPLNALIATARGLPGLVGQASRLKDAQAALGTGATPAAEVANIMRAAHEAGSQWQLWSSPRNIYGHLGQTPGEAAHAMSRNAVKKLLKNYSSAQIRAMLPLFPAQVRDVVIEAIVDAEKREKSQAAFGAWTSAADKQMGDNSAANVTNIYSSIIAGGGRGSVGRQISSASAIYARNNGRSVTTTSRRTS